MQQSTDFFRLLASGIKEKWTKTPLWQKTLLISTTAIGILSLATSKALQKAYKTRKDFIIKTKKELLNNTIINS
jgi:hypothetical protein